MTSEPITKEPSDVGYVAVWVLTIAWVIMAVAFAIVLFKPDMPLNAWGDYVAGVSAPLAFLWLVRGYYQQGEELRQNTAALRQQEAALRQQEEALRLQVAELRQSVSLERVRLKSEVRARQPIFRFAHSNGISDEDRFYGYQIGFKNAGPRCTDLLVEDYPIPESAVVFDRKTAAEFGSEPHHQIFARTSIQNEPIVGAIRCTYNDVSGERHWQLFKLTIDPYRPTKEHRLDCSFDTTGGVEIDADSTGA